MKKCIEFNGVSKKYEVGEKAFYALDDVSFSIDQHEMVVILGPSGAGKSTLLNIMGGMDHVTDGKVYMDGFDISGYSEKELTHNALIADVADRVIRLKNGKIIENVVNAQPKNINEVNW